MCWKILTVMPTVLSLFSSQPTPKQSQALLQAFLHRIIKLNAKWCFHAGIECWLTHLAMCYQQHKVLYNTYKCHIFYNAYEHKHRLVACSWKSSVCLQYLFQWNNILTRPRKYIWRSPFTVTFNWVNYGKLNIWRVNYGQSLCQSICWKETEQCKSIPKLCRWVHR